MKGTILFGEPAMKRLSALSFACVAALGTSFALPATAHAGDAPPPLADAHTQYPTSLFEGQWAIMAMSPVTVAANKALGPAARLLVTLPDSLKKIVGQDRFSLSRQSGTAWKGTSGDATLTFSLISENSAQIHITGKDNHKLDLPLYRDN
ncbi:hypothetical protein CIW82_03770 [Acetobacter tropicalis]|uniref:Lipocalin-like domain-containing protein n=2 Tax=Acetobacteraceae TaxID=433 RepID=A0A291PEZ5_9PROT|nr:hypothetical protein CIW82_03770 [Acetobacter tropicalis]